MRAMTMRMLLRENVVRTLALIMLTWVCGCVQKMTDQPRLEPLERSGFYEHGMSARKPVIGTVSRGHQRDYTAAASAYYRSGRGSEGQTGLPREIRERYGMQELLTMGKEHYEAYCIYCHDLTGSGNGIVPQRGFPYPPSFHRDATRQLPVQAIFQVISEGKGRMQPYATQITVEHRWAVAAYVKTLQFSRYVELKELTSEDRARLDAAVRGEEG